MIIFFMLYLFFISTGISPQFFNLFGMQSSDNFPGEKNLFYKKESTKDKPHLKFDKYSKQKAFAILTEKSKGFSKTETRQKLLLSHNFVIHGHR